MTEERDIREVLQEKFPEMTPVRSAPSLGRINGIGTGMYGRRDFDDETGTYVKTQCVSLLFVPVAALKAYRVADADPEGWYFLGREPLSALAQAFNVMMLGLVLFLGGAAWWQSHTSTPEYQAGERLEQAREWYAQGEPERAVRQFVTVARGKTSHAQAAREEIDKAYANLADLPREDAVSLITYATRFVLQDRPIVAGEVVARAAIAVAEKHAADDPVFAIEVLDGVAPLKSADALGKRRKLLEAAVKRQPNDCDLVSSYCVYLEGEQKYEECMRLLAPLEAQLGAREGARILGSLHARDGRFDKARALLSAYCDDRLAKLRAAEKKLTALQERLYQRAIGLLNDGKAHKDWYAEYETATEVRQAAMVQEYIAEAFRNNEALGDAERELTKHTPVVSVALDLGVVILRMAQGLPPDRRKVELEAAEKVFLSIRGIAGESDQFRLSYAQVLFWLGKEKDAAALFDEYLQGEKRTEQRLLTVAGVLREVGDVTQARKFAEEAYAVARFDEGKQNAAWFRSVLMTDVKDEVLWLARADQTNPHVRAALEAARGRVASEGGRQGEAVAHLRTAAHLYAGLAKSSSTLNNAALAYLGLFNLAGDPDDLSKGVNFMEEALSLQPGDSILLGNVADALVRQSVVELVKEHVDFKAVRTAPDVSMLRYLFDDEATRSAVYDRLIKSESCRKSISYREKVMLLAPKSTSAYESLTHLYNLVGDAAALRRLKATLDRVTLDLSSHRKEAKEHYAGTNDAERTEQFKAHIQKRRKVLDELSAREQGLARSIALEQVLDLVIGGEVYGIPFDADEIVRLTTEQYKARPSRASRVALTTCLCVRASRDLAKRHPAYGVMRERCQRGVPDTYLLVLAAEKDPELKKLAAAHADVRRAAELMLEGRRKTPSISAAWGWAFFRQFRTDALKEAEAGLRGDDAQLLTYEIRGILNPASAQAAIQRYWVALMRNEPDQAIAVLRQVAKLGAPLPWDP